MFRAYRYRLYPTHRQRDALQAQLDACRDLYNAALEQRRRAWRDHGVSIRYGDQSAELKTLRAAELLPSNANFWCQQTVLRHLDRAFQAFFRRVARGEKPGFPRFKAARRFHTLSWNLKAGGSQITPQRRLHLQGIGAVKVRWHRELPLDAELGEIKVTRSSDGRRWHVCFCAEIPDPAVERPAAAKVPVGVDLGVRRLVSLSTGEQLPGPRAGRRSRAAVRRGARTVARRKQGSKRRHKAQALLARHREREANRRRDRAHKLSRQLIDRFDLIAVEDLRIVNMIRSARGTAVDSSRRVAGKRGLNREIVDQGWGQLVSMLAYKAEEAGGQLVKVHPKNTSRTCARCGTVDARSRRAGRFRCTKCGHTEDADINAAKVILDRALSQQALNRPGRGRQAPTDALAPVA